MKCMGALFFLKKRMEDLAVVYRIGLGENDGVSAIALFTNNTLSRFVFLHSHGGMPYTFLNALEKWSWFG